MVQPGRTGGEPSAPASLDGAFAHVFQKYGHALQRAAEVQRRVKESRQAENMANNAAVDVQPLFQNLVPGTQSNPLSGLLKPVPAASAQKNTTDATADEVASSPIAVGSRDREEQGDCLPRGLSSSSDTCRRPVRKQSVNSRFRFRRQQPPLSAAPDTAGNAPTPLAVPGAYPNARSLTVGLPVRVSTDADAVDSWCRYSGLPTLAAPDTILNQVVRIVDVQGELARVAAAAVDTLEWLPAQVLRPCSPAEILQNIAWGSADGVREPTDFAESVAAAAFGADPGIDEDTPLDAVPLKPGAATGSRDAGTCVWRMRLTPAVGWKGIHTAVLLKEMRAGTSVDLPPDGSTVRLRILEAQAENSSTGARLWLRQELGEPPYDVEVTLGNGEVCDALECALARMRRDSVAAVLCSDPILAHNGSRIHLQPRELAALHGKDAVDSWRSSSSRTHFLVELLGWDGFNPLCGDARSKLGHAHARAEAGKAAFLQSRKGLALERFRRTANLLSIGLCAEAHQEAAFRAAADRGEAMELRRRCWLNSAQCELDLGRPQSARRYCDAVLLEEPATVKALYRRAVASFETSDAELLEQALEDLGTVLAAEPSNAAAQRLQQKLVARLRAEGRCASVAGFSSGGSAADAQLAKRACADLFSDQFAAAKERLELAQETSNSEAAEAALADMLVQVPRLTAGQIQRLRLAACLERIAASPMFGSESVKMLVQRLSAQVQNVLSASEPLQSGV